MVDIQRDTPGLQHLLEQEEVAVGVLLLTKDAGQDLAGGIVDGQEKAARRLVWAEPVMRLPST